MQPSGRTPLRTEVKWVVGVVLYWVVTFVGGFLYVAHLLSQL
jgi:hypothetical protein